MDSDNMKEVRFDKHCPTCKHWDKNKPAFNPNIGEYESENGWAGAYTREEFIPCYYCLEEGMREGTEVPVEWEAK